MKKKSKSLPTGSQFILGLAVGFSLCLAIQSKDARQVFSRLHQSVSNEQSYVHQGSESVMRFGSPEPDYVRIREGYILSYCGRTKNVKWTYEYLTPANLVGDAKRSPFKNDFSFPRHHVAGIEDFKNSNYDRGHIAAAGNHKHAQSAMDETFLMSNMSPQVGAGFNRDAWRILEEKIRAIALRNIGVHVITGPLWLPENGTVKYSIIGSGVAVPTHFFKVILIEKTNGDYDASCAWIMPNQPIAKDVKLDSFRTTISKVEHVSGLTFFPKLQELNKTQIGNL